MNVLRIKIEGWTASFRYTGFISGYQPTLPVPPLSTIYGLISAAAGEIITPEDTKVGYVFNYESKAVDLETIYELELDLRAKSNVVRREFLYGPELYLYIEDTGLEESFKKPYYPLLLGRSDDLMKVSEIKQVTLNENYNVNLGKTILPFGVKGAYGVIQALPTHFTEEIPRKAEGVKPFILMNNFFKYEENCLFDSEMDWGVWLH